jgi:hypothetical protein
LIRTEQPQDRIPEVSIKAMLVGYVPPDLLLTNLFG